MPLSANPHQKQDRRVHRASILWEIRDHRRRYLVPVRRRPRVPKIRLGLVMAPPRCTRSVAAWHAKTAVTPETSSREGGGTRGRGGGIVVTHHKAQFFPADALSGELCAHAGGATKTGTESSQSTWERPPGARAHVHDSEVAPDRQKGVQYEGSWIRQQGSMGAVLVRYGWRRCRPVSPQPCSSVLHGTPVATVGRMG
jgi:hypothetical protein